MNLSIALFLAGFYVGVIIVLISIYDYLFRLRKKIALLREIEEMPTKPINGLYPGKFAEITGTVEAIGPLLELPDGKGKCVWYSIEVLEPRKRKRSSYENGRFELRRLHYTVNSSIFRVRDDTGSLLVDAGRADIDSQVILDRELREDEEFGLNRFTQLIRSTLVTNTLHKRRIVIRAIRPDDKLYILGTVKKDSQQRRQLIIYKHGWNTFFISTSSERVLRNTLKSELRVKLMVDKWAFGIGLVLIVLYYLACFVFFHN